MKKIVSILLTALMLMSACSLSSLAAGCTCGKVPIIFVEGFASTPLVNTDSGESAFPPTSTDIKNTVQAALPLVESLLVSGDMDKAEDAVVDMASKIFAPIAMNDDGSSKYNVDVRSLYPIVDGHKDGDFFVFYYDWRLDPFDIAAKLNDYIEAVKKATGHDTVSLSGFSMGTAVINTYLVKYGYDDINSVVWSSGALNGVALCGEPFDGDIKLDAASFVDYIDDMMGTNADGEFFSLLSHALYDTGIFSSAVSGATDLLNKFSYETLQKVLVTSFATMPGVWCLVGDAQYESAKAKVFPTSAEKEKFASLIARIDNYHYNVQCKVPEIMKNVQSKIGKMGIVSKYGVHIPAVVTDYDLQSDSVIETQNTSCGATVARFGSTLGDGYTQAVADGHDHVSADNIVDASTCAYPEYTWFVKNCKHPNHIDYIKDLIRYISWSDHQVNVFENASFPQFSLYDSVSGTVTPLTSENSSSSYLRLYDKIAAFIEQLIKFIYGIFDGIIAAAA